MYKIIVLMALGLGLGVGPAMAQSDELKQLELDLSQLSLLKSMLQEMDQSYTILQQGYENIKGIEQGNYNLHETYLDGLLAVSPAVQNDPGITATVSAQQEIVREYGNAFSRFKTDPHFTGAEVNYLAAVYTNLLARSTQDLRELTMVITADSLRMSDAERLSAIDRINRDMQDRLTFLNAFDNRVSLLAARRDRDADDLLTLKKLYGL
jgi:hypothetical protein